MIGRQSKNCCFCKERQAHSVCAQKRWYMLVRRGRAPKSHCYWEGTACADTAAHLPTRWAQSR